MPEAAAVSVTEAAKNPIVAALAAALLAVVGQQGLQIARGDGITQDDVVRMQVAIEAVPAKLDSMKAEFSEAIKTVRDDLDSRTSDRFSRREFDNWREGNESRLQERMDRVMQADNSIRNRIDEQVSDLRGDLSELRGTVKAMDDTTVSVRAFEALVERIGRLEGEGPR
ncbi:MAG: hypothetical protein AAF078_01875 [Planctomycetota bacterium]